jgi:hypothetical protein
VIAKMETIILDPQQEVEVWTGGAKGAIVTLEAHEDGRVWVLQPGPASVSLFERGYLLPSAGQKLRFSLGNGQSVSVMGEPTAAATAVVSVIVEVPDA